MAIHRTARTSRLIVPGLAAAVVAIALFAMLAVLPGMGNATVVHTLRILLGGVGGIALGALLITLINRNVP